MNGLFRRIFRFFWIELFLAVHLIMRCLKPYILLLTIVILSGVSGTVFSQVGVSVDTTTKKAYNFNNIRVKKLGQYVVLEDTVSNNIPININPLASINRVEELNKGHHYAIVFCLNRYFIINKYGEMSAPFEEYPEFYDHEKGLVFVKMFKSAKASGLYDFKGKEIGKLSKYKYAYQECDMKTNECYYIFQDSKKKKGLMNMKGELLLECKYADIGSISEGKFIAWITTKKQEDVELSKLKPLEWKK